MFEGAKDGIEFGLYEGEMERFKVEQIYERLREEEEETDTCVSCIHSFLA